MSTSLNIYVGTYLETTPKLGMVPYTKKVCSNIVCVNHDKEISNATFCTVCGTKLEEKTYEKQETVYGHSIFADDESEDEDANWDSWGLYPLLDDHQELLMDYDGNLEHSFTLDGDAAEIKQFEEDWVKKSKEEFAEAYKEEIKRLEDAGFEPKIKIGVIPYWC